MNTKKLSKSHRLKQRRKWRVRKRTQGTAEKPRMSVFRSSKNIFVQLIDDETGTTLASTSTIAKGEREKVSQMSRKEAAKALGNSIAAMAKSANIERVVFDRGSCKYHGIVKELAEGAREAGLIF